MEPAPVAARKDRARIGRVAPQEARARLDFTVPEGRTVVFVFGGSQGSRSLNRGLFRLQDFVWFGSFITVCLLGTSAILSAKRA